MTSMQNIYEINRPTNSGSMKEEMELYLFVKQLQQQKRVKK